MHRHFGERLIRREQPIRLASFRAIRAAVIVLLVATTAGRVNAQPGTCGDCNGDGTVDIAELIRGVDIALGSARLSQCPAADVNGSGEVDVSDLIQAVGRAITGACSGIPPVTATASPSSTPTVSPTPQLSGPDLIQGGEEIARENISTFTVLSFGTVGARHSHTTASALRARLRLAARPRMAIAPINSSLVVSMCSTGAAVVSPCTNDTVTVEYQSCTSTTPSGHSVVENGTVVEHVAGSADSPAVFCSTGEIRLGDTDELTFTDYTKTEGVNGDASFAEIDATAAETFTKNDDGCLQSDGTAAPDGTQRVDGRIAVTCMPGAESLTCPPGGTNRVVTADNLILERTSGGFPCQVGLMAKGALNVNDRASGAMFTQAFDGFLVTEVGSDDTKDPPNTSLFQELGNLSVGCLGALDYMTTEATKKVDFLPIKFPQASPCPIDGTLEVARPIQSAATALVSQQTSGDSALDPVERMTVQAASVGNTYSDQLLRASGGPVYQVLQEQNAGEDVSVGANGFQVTSLVGTERGSLTECHRIASATVNPEAGVAADKGSAFPPSRVFKSPIIADATPPCFNRNFAAGDGGVCIGPGCTNDCVCAPGQQCFAFTIHDSAVSTVITQATDGIPAASLEPIQPFTEKTNYPNCGGLADNGDAYRFGNSGPTVETQQCGPVPADGFVLRSNPPQQFANGVRGSTVIFAYDTPLASLFAAGSAGFAVDETGGNRVCSGAPPPVVLDIGNGLSHQVDAPIIHYTQLPMGPGVQFDFDDDGTFDRTVQGCAVSALLQCQ